MAGSEELPKRELADAVKAYLSQERGGTQRAAIGNSSPSGRPVQPSPAGERGTESPSSAAPDPAGKQDLLNAYDRLLEHEATKPRSIEVPEQKRWRRYAEPAVIVLGIAIVAYIWIVQPAWLFPRFRPDLDQTPRDPERGLIAAEVLIGQFQTQRGRMPTSMEDLGATISGVSFVPIGSGYRLVTPAGNHGLVLDHQPGTMPSIREVKR